MRKYCGCFIPDKESTNYDKLIFESKEIPVDACKYCTGGVDDRLYLDNEKEFYICGNGFITRDDDIEFKIEYCPKCGRKL